MNDNDTCTVIGCENPTEHDEGITCKEHAYCCERCGNPKVKMQSLSQRPILCLDCGWIPDRGGLEYLFEKNSHFEDWTLETNTEDELTFTAPWSRSERIWRFEVRRDPIVDDWQINGYREDGIGLWNPGGVDTWTEAVAYLLEILDIAEDSMTQPTEHYVT